MELQRNSPLSLNRRADPAIVHMGRDEELHSAGCCNRSQRNVIDRIVTECDGA